MSTRLDADHVASLPRDPRRPVEQAVETLARRFPFVMTSAGDFPVSARTFSERLFYRLNTIHFMAGATCLGCVAPSV